MGKLIPSKVRMEGISLYEAGKVEMIGKKQGQLLGQVDGEKLRYSLEDALIFCPCSFFQQKSYCLHLAALEYFLKNDEKGQQALAELEREESLESGCSQDFSRGGRFLASLSSAKEVARYQLAAFGQVDALTNRILWTLKVGMLESQKYYVVRDIPFFLTILKQKKAYTVGKYYETSLGLEQFDSASQSVLTFLSGLVEDTTSGNSFFHHQGRHLYFPLSFFETGVTHLMQLPVFQFEHQLDTYSSLSFHDLYPEAGLFSFQVTAFSDYYELEIGEARFSRFYKGAVLFAKGAFYLLNPQQIELIQAIQSLNHQPHVGNPLPFLDSERDTLASFLPVFEQVGEVLAPQELRVHSFVPSFWFERGDAGELVLQLEFDYGEKKVKSRQELQDLPFASNLALEQEVFDTMLAAGFEADFTSRRPALTPAGLAVFFKQTIPAFERLGKVSLSDEIERLYQLQSTQLEVDTKGGYLEVRFDFQGISLEDMERAYTALAQDQDFYITEGNQVYFFDHETKELHQSLQDLEVVDVTAGTYKLRKTLASTVMQLFEGGEKVVFSDTFQRLAHDLAHPEDFPLQTPNVQASLRDYQELGVRWMQMLHHYGFGGILADDMGLGKTLQTISFLTSQVTAASRVLVLAPSGLVYNWADEFKRFAPALDVVVVHGSKASREELLLEDHQVMVTSYATFRQDSEQYQEKSFDFLFLDEAQMMKNAQTKIAQILRHFHVPSVFALSGTPIENHLGELWSIFQIVLPGLLPSKKAFAKLPAEKIARLVQPFIMRRKKEDVLTELPSLIEVVHKNELDSQQKAIYLAQLQQMKGQLEMVSEAEFQKNRVQILSGLMRLRQICDTPALFLDDYAGASGKLESLRSLLQQVAEGKHRVLIFSQFRGMLDLIEQELPDLGLEAFKITGSTPARERQEMTKAFNAGEKEVFLISLKAGGVGLNLTGADTVILVDLWWNPAVEEQAIGRAHRMGQKQNVEVYRLITQGTIEENIHAMQEKKKNLVATVLDGAESRASLTLEEIREILGISAPTLENSRQ